MTIRPMFTALALLTAAGFWHARTLAQEAPSAGLVTVFDHEKVDASFAKADAKGGNNHLWSRTVGGVDYDVHTHSRGASESACPPAGCSHKGVTEVMYVVSGAATIVVGGKTRAVRPDKFGGAYIQGGESHRVSKGDVFVVPPDTVHWYTDIEAPFRYFEVPIP
jgi:mannose-6-phosphate isomerase-like protein (cupin superfamily)